MRTLEERLEESLNKTEILKKKMKIKKLMEGIKEHLKKKRKK